MTRAIISADSHVMEPALVLEHDRRLVALSPVEHEAAALEVEAGSLPHDARAPVAQ